MPKPPTVREAGRRGGRARAQALTPEERSAAARAAVQARWAGKPPVPCTVCGLACPTVRAMYAHRKGAHGPRARRSRRVAPEP